MKRFQLRRPTNQSGNSLPGCIMVIIIMLVLGGIAVMLTISSFGQKRPDEIQIAKVGKWPDFGVELNPYQTWYGLFQESEGVFSLKKTKLKIKEIYDHSSDGPKEKTEIQISVNTKDYPILLVTGLEEFEEGEVVGKNHYNTLLAPDRLLDIIYPWGDYTLNSFGSPEYPVGEDTEQQYFGYGIVLIHNHKRQIILEDHYFYGSGPGLVWSGDLDRDGKLDLIIDCICEDTWTNMALFLSSKAGENELVKLVAIWKWEE
ncbi:MAG: hypothetical protein ABJF04_16765 [Reichenbachiella sp.]|uniref:hypothetical protein n=1 Tax=Reichenbachiella sp. TaxID=2184521 RepID=UPI0032644236